MVWYCYYGRRYLFLYPHLYTYTQLCYSVHICVSLLKQLNQLAPHLGVSSVVATLVPVVFGSIVVMFLC